MQILKKLEGGGGGGGEKAWLWTDGRTDGMDGYYSPSPLPQINNAYHFYFVVPGLTGGVLCHNDEFDSGVGGIAVAKCSQRLSRFANS